jgi:hypothetical protein
MKKCILLFFFIWFDSDAMGNVTEAYRHMQKCVAKAKVMKPVEAEQAFRLSLLNSHDDPGFYDLLSDIARNSGLGERINEMWDEYGITANGRELLLKVPKKTVRQAILHSVPKK